MDGNGSLTATVEIPPDFRVVSVHGRRVLVGTVGAMDVPYLEIYRLEALDPDTPPPAP